MDRSNLSANRCPKLSISYTHVIDIIFLKHFEFLYIFLFFPEHINYKKQKNRVNDCLNII